MNNFLKNHYRLPKTKKKRFGEGEIRIKTNKKYVKSPLFSIITVVLNNDKFLEKTIKNQ